MELRSREKQSPLPRRSARMRNRGVALCIKEVKEGAKALHKSPHIHPQSQSESAPRNLASKHSQKSLLCKSKNAVSQIKLPEKYEMLSEFFNSMDCAIRLLHIKDSKLRSSFANISRMIERMRNRRFSYGHLAQIKFILPEAVVTKKDMILDEITSCMVPVLLISLDVEALDNGHKPKTQSANLFLRQVFRSRLLEYAKAHPEGDDIPEETLPHPFNQSKNKTCVNTSDDPQLEAHPLVASHLPVSFNRSFSKKRSRDETEALIEKISKDASRSSSHPVSVAPSIAKVPSDASGPWLASPQLLSTPWTLFSNEVSEQPEEVQATPVKLVYYSPLSATPATQHSKRRPDDCTTSSTSNKLVRRPPHPRCLNFDILSENMVQSIRDKEKKATEERDPALSRAKRRRDMIAALPKLFDSIRFFFGSDKRSVVTKEELLYKLITNNIKLVDRNEVEEQLNLLQELVPEWIHEKVALSGDHLLCINKGIRPDLLRTKLTEAN